MIENKIFELLDLAEGYQEKDDRAKKEVLQEIEEGWNDLPAEKLNCSESSMVALMMIDEYLHFGKPEAAKKWAEVVINDKNRPDSGEKELIRGKILYESGDMEQAREQFALAFKKSKGREFEGENKKYLELLNKPGTLSK